VNTKPTAIPSTLVLNTAKAHLYTIVLRARFMMRAGKFVIMKATFLRLAGEYYNYALPKLRVLSSSIFLASSFCNYDHIDMFHRSHIRLNHLMFL